MKINIITRTSNRKDSFDRCRKSITSQTYKNINHVVICDNTKAVNYVKEIGYSEIHLVNKNELIAKYPSKSFNTGGFAPYNLYFNDIQKGLSGLIMYLDDDDYLVDKNAIAEIISFYEPDTMLVFKCDFWGSYKIPNQFNTFPQLYNIGGSCVVFDAKYCENWDCWKCADFRMIEKVTKKIPKKKFLDKAFVYVPKQNFGLV